MRTVNTRAAASAGFAEAARWYEQEREGLGGEFIAAVDAAVQRAAAGPTLFPPLVGGIRRVPVKRFPYGVFFLAEEDPPRVTVLAILHLHRNPERWEARGTG